jgi:protein phosphatase
VDRYEFAVRSEIGQRAKNEDSFVAESALGLFAIADGLGGYDGGEVASSIAATTLVEAHAEPSPLGGSIRGAEELMAYALRTAHRAIVERRSEKLLHMGTTLSAIHFLKDAAVIGHIGDSRIYRLHDGALQRLTRDHRLVEELPESMRSPELGAVLSRALGVGDELQFDLSTTAIAVGDRFLLCSDGLTDFVGDQRILQLAKRASTA